MDMVYSPAATTSLFCLMCTLTGLLPSTALAASQADLLKQLDMMEQMDELDRQEFYELLEQSDRCAEQLDFSCSRQHMSEARPLMFEPEMEQSYNASQSYYQEMQNFAADLIQETIDLRPQVQFKNICPDPLADYSRREIGGQDFDRIADNWIERHAQHEEFLACKEAFDDSYDIDDWADSLAEMQALEKQLDHRSKATVHELSLASEQRGIDRYIEGEIDTYKDMVRDYDSRLVYLARRNASNSSGNWMDALNTSLQAMNQQMQANNQQILNNVNRLQQEAVRQNQRRYEQSRAAVAAKVREQKKVQELMAEQQRQQQLLRERQKQIIASSKPSITGKSPTSLSTRDAIAQAQEKTRMLAQQRQNSGVQTAEATVNTEANRYVGAGRDFHFTGTSEQYYTYEIALDLAHVNLENQASEFCGSSMKTEIRWGEPVCKESVSEKENYKCVVDAKVNCYEKFCETRFCGTEHKSNR